MSKDTDIKWTESTWNPITGCTKISASCKNCYALRDWAKLYKKENSVYWNRNYLIKTSKSNGLMKLIPAKPVL